ncbi:restriction endonuclease subunit S [Ursidibacter arcticus]
MEQEFLASGGEFKDCRIGEYFQIGTGSLIDAKELVSGEIKRISVKSDNNGIIGSYQTEGIKQARHFENFISVNFFGGVFYHPYKASVEMKVHTLSLKDHSFTRKTGLYIASLLSKSLSGLFSYGNQLSSSLLASGDFFIKLPYSNGKIAFDFMENFVYELQASRLRELQNYLKVTGLANYELSDEERKTIEQFDELLTNLGG